MDKELWFLEVYLSLLQVLRCLRIQIRVLDSEDPQVSNDCGNVLLFRSVALQTRCMSVTFEHP